MPRISIIVPVYKVEKYLDECIQSILNQTLQDFEIILIDDGSPDNCPKMCDDWAKKDSRIRVIHQNNGGLAWARNVGIKSATADIIGFVDSDDWIQPCFIETLYNNLIMYKADCVNSKWTFYNSDNNHCFDSVYDVIEYDKIQIEEEIIKPFFEEGVSLYKNWSNPRWNKLYKASLLKEILPLLNTKISIGEDVQLNLLYLHECTKIISLNNYSGYMCRVNEKSMTRLYKETLLCENLYYMDELKKIATIQKREYKNSNNHQDSVLSDLLWLCLESDNSISSKVKGCKKIKSKMINQKRFLKYNFNEFNIMFKVCFWLIQENCEYLAVILLTLLLKLNKKMVNK